MAIASQRIGTVPGHRYRQNSEINVTPFVDIMLVLLIIFMIAAPLVTTAILVDNPPAAPPTPSVPTRPVFVSLGQSGVVYISREGTTEQRCARSEIATCLRSVTNGNVSERINVRAEPSVRYGEVVSLMDDIKTSGYLKIAIVSEETD